MLKKFKNLYKVQKEGKKIKKNLTNLHIEANVGGIIVIINGSQEVISVEIPDELYTDPKKLQTLLIKAFNKAIKKSQQVAAEQMKGVMGDLGLDGLPGL